MEKHNLNVDILSVFVEEILKKVTDTFVSDMSTDNNMPEGLGSIKVCLSKSNRCVD